jgi:hypothetical protein
MRTNQMSFSFSGSIIQCKTKVNNKKEKEIGCLVLKKREWRKNEKKWDCIFDA